jgi:hypothetical protein
MRVIFTVILMLLACTSQALGQASADKLEILIRKADQEAKLVNPILDLSSPEVVFVSPFGQFKNGYQLVVLTKPSLGKWVEGDARQSGCVHGDRNELITYYDQSSNNKIPPAKVYPLLIELTEKFGSQFLYIGVWDRAIQLYAMKALTQKEWEDVLLPIRHYLENRYRLIIDLSFQEGRK